jgi:hypothetical protein
MGLFQWLIGGLRMNVISVIETNPDPPKSPLIRGTLIMREDVAYEFQLRSPLIKGARGIGIYWNY